MTDSRKFRQSSLAKNRRVDLPFSRVFNYEECDAGLLFEEFFSRVSPLVIPAFAFVTVYSLIVILFARPTGLSRYTHPNRISMSGVLPMP